MNFAFVADAPGKNARVIEILIDHFAKHLFGERANGGISQLFAAELPERNFRNEKNAVTVAIIENFGRLRIMDRPSEDDLKILHVVIIVEPCATGLREAFPGRIFVARHASQANGLAI